MTSATAARALDSSTMALLGGVGGDEGLDGEVVHRPGESARDLVDQGGGVVAEQGVCAPGQVEVVAEVTGGLLGAHAVMA